MAKYEVIRSSAVFVILLSLFVSIILFIFLSPPEVREEILPPHVVSYEKTLFDVSPGTLEYTSTNEGNRQIPLMDITVDNTPQRVELDVARDASFSAGLFTNEVYEFGFAIELDKVKSAGLSFVVYDVAGNGEVDVYLNGKQLNVRKLSVGNTVEVDFPANILKEGANHVEITADSPGITFWRKNSITLLDMTLYTEEYETGTAKVSQVFSLSASEAMNARDVTLTAMIISEGKTANLDIKLNGQRLMKVTPPQSIKLDIQTSGLKAGANLLEWYVERDGKYTIRFANMLVDTVKTSGRAATYFFTIHSEDWRKVESDNYECVLLLNRDEGDDSVIIEMNAKIEEYYFVGEELTIDICEFLIDGKNEIRFSTEDELDLSRAKLVIENK